MANEFEIKRMLREAAEKLLGKRLTEQEISSLYRFYLEASGSSYNKAVESLSKFSQLSKSQIIEKRSSSDDLDRVMRDLERKLDSE